VKEVAQGGGGGGGDGGFFEGGVHHLDPAVAGGVVNGEGGVAHAETGVAAGFEVIHGATEAKFEEVAEALFGTGEVMFGVHGAEDVVGSDLAVEGGDEAGKTVFANLGINFVFGNGLTAHKTMLRHILALCGADIF